MRRRAHKENSCLRKALPLKGRAFLLSCCLALLAPIAFAQGSDSRFEQSERFVFQERLVARFGEPNRLGQRRVLADTVLVADLTGATVFRPGVDYILSPFGEFTELLILPTGSIADGQTLLVSYRHIFSPAARFSTLAWNYSLELDYNIDKSLLPAQ